jgi:hypothetical protein
MIAMRVQTAAGFDILGTLIPIPVGMLGTLTPKTL